MAGPADGPAVHGRSLRRRRGLRLRAADAEGAAADRLPDGFLLYGSMASLYAAVPGVFPAAVRASGTGLALGIGRIGATVGPYVGGLMVAAAWSRPAYLTAMSAPLLVCAGALALLSGGWRPGGARHLMRPALAGQNPISQVLFAKR